MESFPFSGDSALDKMDKVGHC